MNRGCSLSHSHHHHHHQFSSVSSSALISLPLSPMVSWVGWGRLPFSWPHRPPTFPLPRLLHIRLGIIFIVIIVIFIVIIDLFVAMHCNVLSSPGDYLQLFLLRPIRFRNPDRSRIFCISRLKTEDWRLWIEDWSLRTEDDDSLTPSEFSNLLPLHPLRPK